MKEGGGGANVCSGQNVPEQETHLLIEMKVIVKSLSSQ